jgi:hypothetical protein
MIDKNDRKDATENKIKNVNFDESTLHTTMIDIQTRKLRFMEEYIRLTDETIIEKLAQLLKEEKRKTMQAKLAPMTKEQLIEKLDLSEADIREGRVHTQEEVENYFKNKRSK